LIRKNNAASAAYASNTSLGSTNNLLGTPGGGMFEQKNPSPINTYEQHSNPSLSPNTDMNLGRITKDRQIEYDKEGNMIITNVSNDYQSSRGNKRSTSLILPS
jgi:hypothetical protein